MDPEEVERRLKREAEEEEARHQQDFRDRKMDQAFDADFMEIFNMTPSEIAAFGANMPELINVDEAQRVIKQAKKQYKKGKREQAKATINSDRHAKAVAKKAKEKGKGCAVVALLMITVSGATSAAIIWGAVEAIAAVLP